VPRLALEGTDLYYETSGAGRAVLLIHGFGLDARMWDEQVTVLREVATVVRYDARGFGRSSRRDPEVAYTHAADGWALLDHLGVGDGVVVVGLSMGGRIALEMVVVEPSRAKALVVLDAVLDGVPWDTESEQGMAAIGVALKAGGLPAARSAWLQHGFFGPANRDPAVAARLRRIVDDFPGLHWTEADPHASGPSVIDGLTQITVPTTVVVGDLDVPCFQEMADILASAIPYAHKVVVPNAGHMVNLEAPDAVNQVLLEVIRSSSTNP
jgi:3-oxoadipate enol-lactonase